MQRMTKQRAAIVAALKAGQNFVSAQDLHDQLKAEGATTSIATVYRNLQDLAASGEVDVLRVENSEMQLFRYCGDDAHHHHLVCRNCGNTKEIKGSTVEKWAQAVAANYGFTAVTHSLELYGLCSKCQ